MKRITELAINPEKKVVEMVEAGRVATQKLADEAFHASAVKFVGWQLHYIIESAGGDILSSVGGYVEGFSKEDYED